MYLLIKRDMVVGIFSTKEHMKAIIESLIKDDYERSGVHGNYSFRYIEFDVDQPWFNKLNDNYPDNIGRALFSLSTMHTEYFNHCVKTDWTTGEIIDMDSTKTTNV